MASYIRFDWAMKRLLRNKANHVVLEGFMSVLLKRQIKIKTMLESEGNQENDTQKFNRVDMLAEAENGELYLFEIQNSYEIDYFHRMLFGTSKVITDYLGKGEPYCKIKKVYSVNIVYFSIGQGDGYAYYGNTKFVNMNDSSDYLQFTAAQKEAFGISEVHDIFPEYFIFKVNNFNDYAKSSLQEWISFLKTGEIPDSFTAQGLDEARKILAYDKLDNEARQAYNRYLDTLHFNASVIDSNWREGHIAGRAEGRAEEKLVVARKMLADGMSIELVAKYSGLTPDEISKI